MAACSVRTAQENLGCRLRAVRQIAARLDVGVGTFRRACGVATARAATPFGPVITAACRSARFPHHPS